MTPTDFKKLQEKFPIGPGVAKLNAPSDNENAKAGTKLHHAEFERDKKKPLVEAVPREAKSMGRTLVRFTGYRVRLLDPDNFAGSVKDLLDGLRHAGLLDDDSPDKIILETQQFKIRHQENEKTVIEIIW
jgi:hypothetical protein